MWKNKYNKHTFFLSNKNKVVPSWPSIGGNQAMKLNGGPFRLCGLPKGGDIWQTRTYCSERSAILKQGKRRRKTETNASFFNQIPVEDHDMCSEWVPFTEWQNFVESRMSGSGRKSWAFLCLIMNSEVNGRCCM